jgi:sugar phosphate isomerase/epimerase
MQRRTFLKSALAAGAIAATQTAQADLPKKFQQGKSPWPLCLNTSTIRPASILEKIDAAGAAGYDAMELWTQDLEGHVKSGGDIRDLRKRIEDHGMFVINVIGLWDGMPPEESAYRKQMDVNKKRMQISADVGSKHIAVLPLPDRESFDLKQTTARYREILEIGLNEIGIQPSMEFVSVFKGIRRLGQAAQIALDADHPKATIIPDIFHLHNGGSGFNGIQFLQGSFISTFHWNDVPASPPAGQMSDGHRIYPGDGILPLDKVLQDLQKIGYTGPLSLELFRREHYKMDPKIVAKNGLNKMLANVQSAVG